MAPQLVNAEELMTRAGLAGELRSGVRPGLEAALAALTEEQGLSPDGRARLGAVFG